MEVYVHDHIYVFDRNVITNEILNSYASVNFQFHPPPQEEDIRSKLVPLIVPASSQQREPYFAESRV